MKLLFDASRCTGCRACEAACSFVKEGVFAPSLSRIRVVRLDWDGVDVPTGCEQCTDAPCILACPVKALVRKGPDDVVLLDTARCIGCKQCIVVCPFGALHYDGRSGKVFKCDLCGGDPECVKWCFTGGVRVLEADMVESERRHRTARRAHAIMKASGGGA